MTNPVSRSAAGPDTLYLAGLWFLYLLLSPVYIFPSGMPQPSAIALFAAMLPWACIALIRYRGKIPLLYLTGGLFAALAFIINWVNYAALPDTRFALSSLYYPFNFAVCIFAIALFQKNYELVSRLSCAAIIAALFIQGLWAEFLPDPGTRRMTAGFENPNQLAYWTLLSMGMLLLLKRGQKLTPLDAAALLTGAYIQSLALSKAGIITTGLLLTGVLFMPQMPKSGRYAGVLLAIGGMIVLVFTSQGSAFFTQKFEAFERISNRMATLGQENDDSLEGRGYDRLLENPVYMLIGAGEGGFARFSNSTRSKELHSGLATILFSYGILGFILFSAFLYLIFRGQPWHCWLILFCVLLSSLSSQTIRFNHTWIFFAVAYATHYLRPRPIKAPPASHSAAQPQTAPPIPAP